MISGLHLQRLNLQKSEPSCLLDDKDLLPLLQLQYQGSIAPEKLSPQFKSFYTRTRKALGHDKTIYAVVGVPVYFSTEARKGLRDQLEAALSVSSAPSANLPSRRKRMAITSQSGDTSKSTRSTSITMTPVLTWLSSQPRTVWRRCWRTSRFRSSVTTH